ncbi:Protein pns1 [Phytophthora ramorum]|uniref:Protein pns1 n=1 Tax=Phytophthora ramorum TaxID=164328 RepID=UPI0030B16B26|nr:Protein pns1 [Phytophthora ramorum]
MELDRADEEVLLEKVPQQLPTGRRDERKDHFFAVAFAANLAVVSFIALFFGLPNVSSIYFTVHHEDDSSHGLKIVLIFLATTCIGGGVSALWLQVLQNHAERVISWTLKASIVAFVVASLAAFYDSGMAGKAIGFINPSSPSRSSRTTRPLWGTSMTRALLGTCFFFMAQVAKNVVHCVTAGAVGEWWFGAHDVNTIQRAQTRALTTSLGSICVGSLVVAALNALHTLLLSTPRRKAKGSANACLEFLVKLVMRTCSTLTTLPGPGLDSAAERLSHLERPSGGVPGCRHGVGVVGSAWLYLALRCTPDELAKHPGECQTFNVCILTFVACGSIGYAMCTIMSSILDSIVATIFVCFAEDPAALQRSHPDEHARIVEAWSRLQPDLLSFPTHMV